MFNLDQGITAWRQQMVAGGINAPEVLNELESHLRDDVQQQIRAGVAQQTAFDAAVQRLGQASVLKAEFKKGHDSSQLRLKFIVFVGSGLLYSGVMSYILVTHELTGQERLLGFAALAFSMLTCAGLRRAARWVRAEGRALTAIGVTSGVLGVGWFTWFMLVILPHLELTVSQLVLVLLWSFVPMFAGGAFGLGLDECKVRRSSVWPR
jgi:hypothetical protein